MASAYARFLPTLEVVTLSGPIALLAGRKPDLSHTFGLNRSLRVRYLPLLPNQRQIMFDQDYRPPQWFYRLVGGYAWARRSG